MTAMTSQDGELINRSENYYGRYDRKRTVQLFVENLIYGNISINSFSFRMDPTREFVHSLEEKIVEFQHKPTEETVDWIYKAIIKLRVNGALSHELRDQTYEQTIQRLNEQNERLVKEKEEFKFQRDEAIVKIAQLTTTEPPVKIGFNALG